MSNSMSRMVKVNSNNIPMASPCKIIHSDGSITYANPMESKYKSENYTKIGGKPKNRDFIKEDDWD